MKTATKPQLSLIEELTGGTYEDFASRAEQSMEGLLADERSYAQGVRIGDLGTEIAGHALEDLVRLSAHIAKAEEILQDLRESEAQPLSDQEEAILVRRLIFRSYDRLKFELICIFFLHRELEVLRKLVPRAASKIKQENALKRGRSAGTATTKAKAQKKQDALEAAVMAQPTWKPKKFGCLADNLELSEAVIIRKVREIREKQKNG